MITPPAGQSWVIIDEELRPKKERAYSDGDGRLEGKTMEEIQRLKATWIAERDSNGGVVEADNTKTESGGPSSSTSAPAGLGSDRAIYVFRFPSSCPLDGYSDSCSLDAHRQIERPNSHFLRSFYANDFFPFSPFQSFFGLLHPFIFSPSAGVPRNYNFYDLHYPREGEPEDLDPWRRMQDEEMRWRKKVYGFYHADYDSVNSTECKMGYGSGTTKLNEGTPQAIALPPPSREAQQKTPARVEAEAETELDMYEHLNFSDSSSSDESLAPRKSIRPLIISTSTSTESRTLPDGSMFTKTVKITRYDDGSEERVENEHSTLPKYQNKQSAVQGNKRRMSRGIAQTEEGVSGNSNNVLASPSDWRDKEDRKPANDFDLMSQRMFDFLMKSPFFGDEKASARSPVSEELSEKVQSRNKEQPTEKMAAPDSEQSAASRQQDGGWGWFWRK